jgi:hypothetical protein
VIQRLNRLTRLFSGKQGLSEGKLHGVAIRESFSNLSDHKCDPVCRWLTVDESLLLCIKFY